MNPPYFVASFSGGKDSTCMLLRLLDEGRPLDEIVYCDTGLEFPEMCAHIDRVEQYIGRPITRLKAPKSFEYYFYEYERTKPNPNYPAKGLGWPERNCRWCTGRLKTHVVNRHLSAIRKQHKLVQYIGIAADEPKRIKDLNYPLVEWNMTEADCLAYCKERGFDWGGLYDIFRRVSCWCCPLQPLSELRLLRTNFPDLWERLRELDDSAWRSFRPDFTVHQLDVRFALEEEWLAQGLPIRGRAFFNALHDRLEEEGIPR